MIKIHALKYCDNSKSKNPEDWFLSVSHEVEEKIDLHLFLDLFAQTISEHFELGINKVAFKELVDNYIFNKKCTLTFKYSDLSITLSGLENINSNLFKFNYN